MTLGMRGWRSPFIVGIICLVLLSICTLTGCDKSAAAKPGGRERLKVERVIDGDTFEVNFKGSSQKVRMIGIDTPETKKPNTPVMFYGPEAAAYTKKRLEGKFVDLEWDIEQKDQYGRLLAYVWISDEMLNRTLVQEGYARMDTFPPNVKYVELIRKDQEAARKHGKGLWKNYNKAFDDKN